MSDIGTKLSWAALHGDYTTVEKLSKEPEFPVNWQFGGGFTALFNSSANAHIEIVKLLLKVPGIDTNLPNNNNASPCYIASQKGHTEVVEVLLADPRVNPNQVTKDGATPLYVAAGYGHLDVVARLLAHPGTNVNALNNTMTTPLWYAAQSGNLQIVKNLLASEKLVDTTTRSSFNNRTAAEQGRAMGIRRRGPLEPEATHIRKTINGPLIAELIDAYERDPMTVRMALIQELGLNHRHAARLFALVVFLADGYITLKQPEQHDTGSSKVHRFLKMTCALPMDLQMVLCHRMFGSGANLVKTKDSEPAFKWLANPGAWAWN